MKNWYVVTFRWSEKVYCTNLCIADGAEQAEEHYKNKYECVSVRAAYDWEVETYKKRGMPIIEL